MVERICCIFNLAPHYNAAIYSLMDRELKCDFYFGDRLPYSVELMNYESLKGFKKRLKYKSLFGNFYWQDGYGAFSVPGGEIDYLKLYIEKQHQHHSELTFQDEYRSILKNQELDFDERYVWD